MQDYSKDFEAQKRPMIVGWVAKGGTVYQVQGFGSPEDAGDHPLNPGYYFSPELRCSMRREDFHEDRADAVSVARLKLYAEREEIERKLRALEKDQ